MTTFTFVIRYNSKSRTYPYDYCRGIIEANSKEEALEKVRRWFIDNYSVLEHDLSTIEVVGYYDFGEVKILNCHNELIKCY